MFNVKAVSCTKTKFNSKTFVIAIFLLCTQFVNAAVTTEQAHKLGHQLTPLGAEKPGNQDGSIPEWSGGLSIAPQGYSEGQHMVDPYVGDMVLYQIDATNYQEYKAQLTVGQIALFQKYPDTFKINVYPTRRSAFVPEEIRAKARANATKAELVDGGNGVTGYDSYYPFPIPRSGQEVVWNHLMRYRGGSVEREHSQLIAQSNGGYHEVRLKELAVYPEYMDGHTNSQEDDNILVYFRQVVTSPARLSGSVLLVHDTVNQVKKPRSAWIYNAGQRRVRRAPQAAYDGPATASDGLRTADNFDMFTGALDRYDWVLEGKQELYIPYNSYRLTNKSTGYDELINKGHLNPEYLRYEKHRVWKVVATLKKGQSHIYAKREFYIDEDSWQIAYIDQFDSRGDLWRVSEGHLVQYYYADTPWLAAEAVYDLVSRRYLVLGLHGSSSEPVKFGSKSKKSDFVPTAIRRLGIR